MSNRRKLKPITSATLAAFNRGMKVLGTKRCLDDSALWDATHDPSWNLDEVLAFANCEDIEQLKIWCDTFANRYPDDERWDGWRSYRRFETANAN
jgi:hypothetical protein